MLCSLISVYYYLRVMVYMYMRDPVEAAPSTRTGIWAAAVVASTADPTVQLGLMPTKVGSSACSAA